MTTTPRRVLYAVLISLALAVLVLGGLWIYAFRLFVHDKAVTADALQRVWSYGKQVPLGVVVPPHNRWTPNAFVAEDAGRSDGSVKVLILDDHYRSGDPDFASADGIIGDELSHKLLCTIPGQAATRKVELDAVVVAKIRQQCGSLR